jgi:hypothetical protein
MLTPFNQNWRTTHVEHSLALANTVSTGGSFSTPSGAIRNSQIWARAGFRGLGNVQGFGPMMTFPGAGMDGYPLNWQRAGLYGVGCGCGCDGGCSHGLGQLDLFSSWDISTWGIGEWALLGLGFIGLMSVFSTTKKGAQAVGGAISKRQDRPKKRRELKAELKEL